MFAAVQPRRCSRRLNYTSHIPCNGVEEPKSTESWGFGIQVALADGRTGVRLGFGSEPSDLTPAGVAARARQGAARRGARTRSSARCRGRPAPRAAALGRHHDPGVDLLDDAELVEAGWKVLGGGAPHLPGVVRSSPRSPSARRASARSASSSAAT